jgi:PAS domain S-box-containing protein
MSRPRPKDAVKAAMRAVSLPPVNILVVDDRPEDQLVVKSILDDPLYNLITAQTGAEALRRVLENDYAVILLDVYLPDMDGFEIASTIKQRERSRDTPIVFLTSLGADVGALYRGYSVGAVDYLVKPIDQDVLRAKVSIFVDLYRKDLRIKQQAEALIEANRRARAREVAELKRDSEKRYRSLAESIPPIVWTAGPDGAVNYFNQRWFDETGQAPEQAEGWGWMAAIHPDDSREREEQWRAALTSGGIYESECRIRDREGGYRWHLCRAVPERGKSGQVIGWLGTYTDCDDLKRAHAVAELGRGRSELLAAASSLLSSSLDYRTSLERAARLTVPRLADWCVIDVLAEGPNESGVTELEPPLVVHSSPELEERVRELRRRYPPAGGSGGWLTNVLETGRAELVRKITPDVMRALGHDDTHLRLLTELGPESVMCVPMVTRERTIGTMTLVSSTSGKNYDEADLAMARDLAHRAAIAIDNSRLYRAAQRAVALRDEFLSIASHELRTPLTSLLLQLQTLSRMMVDEEPKVTVKLDKAVQQTRRLEKLIENLLDVSRIISGKLTLEIEDVDAAELVRDVAERFADEAARAECPIQVELKSAPYGHWDRVRLEQVVTNLLSNAVRYAPGGAILVRVEEDEGVARLSVIDHGVGIAPDALGRIFGRFERAADGPHHGGLGLGLYITRSIVEAHGGQIRVSSQVGQGSRFVVELPLEPPLMLTGPPLGASARSGEEPAKTSAAPTSGRGAEGRP